MTTSRKVASSSSRVIHVSAAGGGGPTQYLTGPLLSSPSAILKAARGVLQSDSYFESDGGTLALTGTCARA